MAKAEESTLATDQIFQKIKFHVMKSILGEVHEEITRLKIDDKNCLDNVTKFAM